MDAQLSISVEEHDAGLSATHHRGAHRRGCNHLTIQLPARNYSLSTLLIVQHLQPSVVLSQHRDLYAKAPALGNAAKIFQLPSTKRWCPW